MKNKKDSIKRNKKRSTYLDYAATTPIDAMVLKKMMPYLKNEYGNPSSLHLFGQKTRAAIEDAREKVARFLNCLPSEIIFTGSATESDNLAIRGLIKSLQRTKRTGEKIHIITTAIEHKAVLETCADLEKRGVKITYLPVGPDGVINLDDLKSEITPETDLVSIMYANNEVGSVQPIEKIGRIIAEENKHKEHKIYFHTDAVQAANWLNCDVKELGVDLLTLSGHKIYGPKGIGVLYIKDKTPILPIITGGSHEWGLRPGTENVANIVGMGEAIGKIQSTKREIQNKIEKLRNKLIKNVLKINGARLNGTNEKEKRVVNIVNFSFMGVEGESLVISLSEEGIGVSTGSACTSHNLMPSHVIMAMGSSELMAHSSLRVSLGKYTTPQEIDYFLKILLKIINKLRKISGR
jgi:cysteine desulfurase